MRNYIFYKAFLKDLFLCFIRKIFLKNSLSILMYHKIDETNEFYTLKIDELRWQMQYLKDNNYKIISLNSLIEKIKNNEKIDYKTIVITFDDGHRDNFINAYPILIQYNYPATIFLSTGLLGDNKMLSWDEIKQMYNNGIDFEPHTQNHVRLTQLNDDQIKEEILKSKQDIEHNLNKKCLSFAYPWGSFNKNIIKILKELGFNSAVTVKYGFANKNSNLYELPRNSIDSLVTKSRFKMKI